MEITTFVDTRTGKSMRMKRPLADLIVKHGRGRYMTRDMVAEPGTVPLQAEVDVEGHAWNADIHAASRAKTATGAWRKKPGARK